MPTSSINPPVLARNIDTALTEALVQISHADKVGTRARTGYYKVAILLLASVIEAQLHYLITIHAQHDPTLFATYGTGKKLKKITVLNKPALGTTKDLYICEEVIAPFKLNKGTLLDAMNVFCCDCSITGEHLKSEIDYIKNKRNEIHLQGLSTTQRTFTKKMIDRAANVIAELFILLDNAPTAT